MAALDARAESQTEKPAKARTATKFKMIAECFRKSPLPLLALLFATSYLVNAQYDSQQGYGGGGGADYGGGGGGGYDNGDAYGMEERPKVKLGIKLRIPAFKFELPRFSLPKITVSAKIRQPSRPRVIQLPEINIDTASKSEMPNKGHDGGGGGGGYGQQMPAYKMPESSYGDGGSQQGGYGGGGGSGGNYGGAGPEKATTLTFSTEEHKPAGNQYKSGGYQNMNQQQNYQPEMQHRHENQNQNQNQYQNMNRNNQNQNQYNNQMQNQYQNENHHQEQNQNHYQNQNYNQNQYQNQNQNHYQNMNMNHNQYQQQQQYHQPHQQQQQSSSSSEMRPSFFMYNRPPGADRAYNFQQESRANPDIGFNAPAYVGAPSTKQRRRA